MKKTPWSLGIVVLMGVLLTTYRVQLLQDLPRLEAAQLTPIKPLPGLGALSGTVEAPKPFKAAMVHARNVDKNITYLVYTSGGRYQAVNLFPGNYEVTVEKKGFKSDVKQVRIDGGTMASANFALQEDPANRGRSAVAFGGPNANASAAGPQLLPFNELYPPGPGRDEVLNTCVYCHGANFFPGQQRTEEGWKAAVDMMMNATRSQGAQIVSGGVSSEKRAVIASYLAKNFRPGSPKRALKMDAEMPLDEQALSTAMYIEYYLPMDPKLDAKNSQRRSQDPYFDNNGNVWYTDRSIPNRVGMLDPRTGAFKDYVLPDPQADPHGLTVDKFGMVWWAETRGLHLGRLNPKTGEMVRIKMDEKGELGAGQGHTPVLDSKQNIWFTVIIGNRLGKWDRETEKVRLWEPPTPISFPYGIKVDKDDKIWIAEFHGCKVAKFDPATEKWTEYSPLTKPCTMRRMSVDSKGTAWYALFSSSKIGKIDPRTSKVTEYNLPMPFGEPYDIWPDPQDNVWTSDGMNGGVIIKFDPRSEKFTYYPSPQSTDMPKFEITRDGAIWYAARSGLKAAVGALYPDVAKMKTIAAYY